MDQIIRPTNQTRVPEQGSAMKSRFAARASLSMAGAVLLSLLLAGQVLAATWGTPVTLNSPGADYPYPGGLVTLGSSTAVVVYGEGYDPTTAYARRSTDSGSTWSSPLTLSSDVDWGPKIAGRGSKVDVVWTQDGRLRYARSTDGGASFGPSVALSPAAGTTIDPYVARGPGGQVAVVWQDWVSGIVSLRVSADGGASFGPTRTLTTDPDVEPDGVAIGKGVIYVAYSVGYEKLRVKRSTDSGASWSTPQRITDKSQGSGVSITAAGRKAYIAYTLPSSGDDWFKVSYRQTTDKGASWSPQRQLSPASWTASNPHLALQGGVLRAAFERCTPEWDICVANRVFYQQSSNGIDWTTPERVSPRGEETMPAGVGFAGKILVLYGWGSVDIRAGTP